MNVCVCNIYVMNVYLHTCTITHTYIQTCICCTLACLCMFVSICIQSISKALFGSPTFVTEPHENLSGWWTIIGAKWQFDCNTLWNCNCWKDYENSQWQCLTTFLEITLLYATVPCVAFNQTCNAGITVENVWYIAMYWMRAHQFITCNVLHEITLSLVRNTCNHWHIWGVSGFRPLKWICSCYKSLNMEKIPPKINEIPQNQWKRPRHWKSPKSNPDQVFSGYVPGCNISRHEVIVKWLIYVIYHCLSNLI